MLWLAQKTLSLFFYSLINNCDFIQEQIVFVQIDLIAILNKNLLNVQNFYMGVLTVEKVSYKINP